jgi:hypothetical protein
MLYVSRFFIVLQGCAASQTHPRGSVVNGNAAVSCPTNAGQLESLKTEKQVTTCFGKSSTTTSQPDGRHTALYQFGAGVIVVFLFDKDGSVIRNRVYQDSNAK